MKRSNWHGCYDQGWGDLIVPEAFAHPAKYAYGLITRIIDHGLRQGYWKTGDLIGDPFGGIASGGIAAGYRGLNWLGVELEPKFVALGNLNLVKHGPAFMQCGASMVKLVQGDSRRFAEIVAGELQGCVTSPPYSESLNVHGDGIHWNKVANGRGDTFTGRSLGRGAIADGYGQTLGNIGNLPAGTLDGAVTSPPFVDARQGTTDSRLGKTAPTKHDPDALTKNPANIDQLPEGTMEGVVTSPPYADSDTKPTKLGTGKGTRANGDGAGRNKGDYHYPESPGQIGVESQETYWQAVAEVYRQVLLALRPGGVMACVVKSYVKKGQIVDLPTQTCELLASLGFDVFERTRAWLVKQESHPSLFGGEETKTKERKSFFRRLAEKKGSPRIDWEEVIWVR